ncbi:MAG TPA: hypothetical protein VGI56_05970, partial [Galbitalea sp.]
MSQVFSTDRTYASESTRSWTLVHAGVLYPMSWEDGERLLALSSRVRMSAAEPQAFTFRPLDGTSTGPVTIFVTPDDPL